MADALIAITLGAAAAVAVRLALRAPDADRVSVGMSEAEVELLLGGPPNVSPGLGDFWIRRERREEMKTIKAWKHHSESRKTLTERIVIVAFAADGRVAKSWIRETKIAIPPPWIRGWNGTGPRPTPTLFDRYLDWVES
jgi:hypothetical protein